ncbi:hypothetical protein HMI54_013645 [Coelomomyces lativittatus]|nr:hypothetical protein HMI54_013645 [Coelomomyces lativittatus]
MRFLQPFISQRFHHPYVSTNPFLSLFQTHLTPNAPVLVKLSIQTRYSSTLKVQPATVKSSSSHSRLTVDEAVSFIKVGVDPFFFFHFLLYLCLSTIFILSSIHIFLKFLSHLS